MGELLRGKIPKSARCVCPILLTYAIWLCWKVTVTDGTISRIGRDGAEYTYPPHEVWRIMYLLQAIRQEWS